MDRDEVAHEMSPVLAGVASGDLDMSPADHGREYHEPVADAVSRVFRVVLFHVPDASGQSQSGLLDVLFAGLVQTPPRGRCCKTGCW